MSTPKQTKIETERRRKTGVMIIFRLRHSRLNRYLQTMTTKYLLTMISKRMMAMGIRLNQGRG